MQTVSIEGKIRDGRGKKANKDLRGGGLVPAVIYGGDTNITFSAPASAFRALVYTPDFHVAEITVAGKTYRAFVKELQFHPVNDSLVHVDFVELIPGKEVKVLVPLRLTGVSKGVKIGGKLLQNVRKVLLKTSVESLVDHVSLDITELDLGKSLRIRDIKVGDDTQIMQSAGTPVVTIEIPRALRSAQAAAAKEEGKKKK